MSPKLKIGTKIQRMSKKMSKEKENVEFTVSSLPKNFFEMSDDEQKEWVINQLKKMNQQDDGGSRSSR